VHYIPTDKINASIHIRIQQILKVNIRPMQILTSFITSRVHSVHSTYNVSQVTTFYIFL